MGDMCESRNSKIKEIFESMEYGNVNKPKISQSNTLNVLTKSTTTEKPSKVWQMFSSTERCEALQKFADEIEKNASTFTDFLTNDVERNVKLLSQYISYYSSFAFKVNGGSLKKPLSKGNAVFLGDGETPFWSLGLFLGPSLASGYSVELYLDKSLINSALFLESVSKKAGIPDTTISIFPLTDITPKGQTYMDDENVEIITIFGDLRRDIFKKTNIKHKKIINLSPLKTPFIVFDGSDLDSAVDCLVNATWNFGSMQPWTVNKAFIQENIFKIFLKKLKNIVSKLRPEDVNFDEKTLENASNKLEKARKEGVDLYLPFPQSIPAILIGKTLSTNKVLDCEESDGILSVLAFRTIDEGINLANNGRQGFGASLWSENVSLINEVSQKLNVSNVWVNSYGLITPNVPFSPLKDSGTGYFGGNEGFYEYYNIKKIENISNCAAANLQNIKPNASVISAINSAKKAQESWARTTVINRIKIFQNIASILRDKNLETSVYDCILNKNKLNYNSSLPGYTVTSIKLPKGVIAIECNESNNFKLIISALFEGNTVILLSKHKEYDSIYIDISKKLPNGVLSIFSYNAENIQSIISHNEINGYLADNVNAQYGSLILNESKLFSIIQNENIDYMQYVTYSKNVWTTVGQSSQCNL